jgi:hypothetical protein
VRAINALRMRSPAAGVGGGLTIRGTALNLINASVYNIPLHSGAQLGDTFVVFFGHPYGFNNVFWDTGNGEHFSHIDFGATAGGWWNGYAVRQTLQAGDIANGYVQIGWGGAEPAVVVSIVIAGAIGGVRAYNSSRQESPGSATRSVTTANGTPQAGDTYFCWGSARRDTTPTCDLGTVLQQSAGSGSPRCGVLTKGVVPAPGALTANFNYNGVGDGTYQCVAVLY